MKQNRVKFKIILASILVLFVLSLPVVCLAEGQARAPTSPEPKHWWEIVGGIVAIPVALIGVVYSYVLIRKTRLESRKMELEICEKEQAIAKVIGERSEEVQRLIRPLIESKNVQFLLLRFVIMFLLVEGWALVEKGFQLLLGGMYLGISSFTDTKILDENLWVLIPLFVVAKLPQIGYWIVFVALGWPLFRDVNEILGLNLKDIFKWGSR